MATTKLNHTGCDYLRLTCNDHKPHGAWLGQLAGEFKEEDEAGRRAHYRWVMGYYGRVGEHCFIGKSDAGCMVQASGVLANELFESLSHAGGKATRIDLQMTVPVITTPSDTLMESFIMASAHTTTNGRHPDVQIVDTNYGAKMVTIGSRQSQVYGRIYDKYKESKIEEYRDTVRYEIEVKQPQSVDLHHYLVQDKLLPFHTKAIVTEWFRKRGVPVFWDQFEEAAPMDIRKRTKNDETKAAWLSAQVKPTVRELCKKGKALKVAEALAGQGASEADIIELARQLAIVCAD